MDLDSNPQLVANVEARVRRNAGSAGLVAGLLIFFGFIWLAGEVGEDLSANGGTVLRYALRLGGIAMIGVAIASSVGTPTALLVDGIVCLLVGLLVAFSAVVMVAGGTLALTQVVVFVCGILLATLGLRTLADHRAIVRGLTGSVEEKKTRKKELQAEDDPFRAPADASEGCEVRTTKRLSNTRSASSGAVGRRGKERTPHRH